MCTKSLRTSFGPFCQVSCKEIARQLVVALGTAKTHTASLYRKLDVFSRTKAVARARELGLL
ncbi:MAG: helix-turn-helix transcriptional regulator [Acidobacteriaceae bacterium]